MAGVRDGLVAASCTVDMRFLMAAAIVIGRAVRRIHGRGINRVFVHVVAVNVVKVAIVKIVPVTLVPDCGMPAPKSVRMAVAVVFVQCGLGNGNILRCNDLHTRPNGRRRKLLICLMLRGWLLGLDSNQQPSG
jgi:hypothetical protein